MTIHEMQALAAFHATTASQQAELALHMQGKTAELFRRRAEQHSRWADQLTDLCLSFHTFTDCTQKP